jgi:hypothetical protein
MRLHVFQNSIIEYTSWKKLKDVHMAAANKAIRRADCVDGRHTRLSNPTSGLNVNTQELRRRFEPEREKVTRVRRNLQD